MKSANQKTSRNLPHNYNQLQQWIKQYYPEKSLPKEVMDEIISYVDLDPTSTEYKYTPWLIREVSQGRLNKRDKESVQGLLNWFVWLRKQPKNQVEAETGLSPSDFNDILNFRYPDLQSLYYGFLTSNSALTRQYQNFLSHR